MKPSEKAFELIRKYEGLVLHAYPDPATGGKPYTIGYGSTRHLDGTPISLGETITKDQAEQMMEHEVGIMADQIKATVNQNQFDALCVFAYNVGIDGLLRSTLYKKVRYNPSDPSIEMEFNKWVFANHKIFQGLVDRRKAEWALYAG